MLEPVIAGRENTGQSRLVLGLEILQRFTNLLTPQDAGELASMRKWLIRAGYRGPAVVRMYNFAKPAAALAFAAIAFTLLMFFGYDLSAPIKLVIVLHSSPLSGFSSALSLG